MSKEELKSNSIIESPYFKVESSPIDPSANSVTRINLFFVTNPMNSDKVWLIWVRWLIQYVVYRTQGRKMKSGHEWLYSSLKASKQACIQSPKLYVFANRDSYAINQNFGNWRRRRISLPRNFSRRTHSREDVREIRNSYHIFLSFFLFSRFVVEIGWIYILCCFIIGMCMRGGVLPSFPAYIHAG